MKNSLPKPNLNERRKGAPIGLTKKQRLAISSLKFSDKKLLNRIVRLYNIWECEIQDFSIGMDILQDRIVFDCGLSKIEIVFNNETVDIRFNLAISAEHLTNGQVSEYICYEMHMSWFYNYLIRWLLNNDDMRNRKDMIDRYRLSRIKQ